MLSSARYLLSESDVSSTAVDIEILNLDGLQSTGEEGPTRKPFGNENFKSMKASLKKLKRVGFVTPFASLRMKISYNH